MEPDHWTRRILRCWGGRGWWGWCRTLSLPRWWSSSDRGHNSRAGTPRTTNTTSRIWCHLYHKVCVLCLDYVVFFVNKIQYTDFIYFDCITQLSLLHHLLITSLFQFSSQFSISFYWQNMNSKFKQEVYNFSWIRFRKHVSPFQIS